MSAMPATAIIDAFYLCLAASMIWAPIVFLSALFLARRSGGKAEATLWPSALLLAAAPVIAAPVAAGLGLSLRSATPLPPMSAGHETAINVPSMPVSAAPASPAIDLAMVLNAAADLYFYGFVLFAALGLMRLIGFSYRIRYSEPVDDAGLIDGLNEWRRAIGVTAPVRHAYCDAVSSVCVHGFIRPVILMPPSLLEYASREDAILMGAHELAHVKRGDTWLFAFCGLARALFWFNPFMRRIIAHAQLAAEQAADALVIRRGVSRRAYARCFVESLKLSSGLAAPQYELVPSFTPFDKRSRRKRLDAILSGRASNPVISLGGKIVMIASGMLALVLAFGQAALAVAPPAAKDALSVMPVASGDGRITSTYGERTDPISKEKRYHTGIDIAAPTGTPVRAAGAGKVIAASVGYKGSDAWGKVVVVDHGHGLVTRYAQLDSYIVRKGDSVKAGDTIAAVGSTGRSTGPHLHFEVLVDGEHVDPMPVFAEAQHTAAPRTVRRAQLAPTPPPVSENVSEFPAPEPIPAPDIEIAGEPIPASMPAPRVEETPEPFPAPIAPDADELPLGERLGVRLAGKFGEWQANLDENFEAFDGFEDSALFEDLDGLEIHFGDIEIKAIENADEIVAAIREMDFDWEELENIVEELPDYAFVIDGSQLSDEDRRAIEKAGKEAMKAAEIARRDAGRQIEQARRHVKRALKNRERTMHSVEQALNERKRVLQVKMRGERGHAEEMLTLREEALREAEENLTKERAELEQLRTELREEKLNKD